MDRLELDTLVTVLDSGSFISDFASRAPLAARPELGEGGNMRPVVDLLVEQVECADYVVCNKTDMLKDNSQLTQLISIVSSLNPLSTVIPCEQGKVGFIKTSDIRSLCLVILK
jgi:G3E family GTPase